MKEEKKIKHQRGKEFAQGLLLQMWGEAPMSKARLYSAVLLLAQLHHSEVAGVRVYLQTIQQHRKKKTRPH